MYPTCKHAAHLYQTVCEMQVRVSASPCPLACDVAESLPGLNRGMRLVSPMGATRTVCACAGIECQAARSCVCVPNSALGELLWGPRAGKIPGGGAARSRSGAETTAATVVEEREREIRAWPTGPGCEAARRGPRAGENPCGGAARSRSGAETGLPLGRT
jgi:hypothetical protein